MAKHLKTILILVVGLGLASWFIARTDWSVAGVHLRNAKPLPLLIACLLIIGTMVARAVRWQLLLAPIAKVSFRNAFAATSIGFGSVFVVGRAGEIVRPVVLSLLERIRPSGTVATILIERVYDTAAVVLLFSVNLLVFQLPTASTTNQATLSYIRSAGALLTVGVLVGIGVLAVLRLKAAPLLQWLSDHTRGLPQPVVRPLLNLLLHLAEGLSVLATMRALVLSILYSAAVWTMVTLSTWLVVYAFGIALPITHVIFVLGFGLVGSLVPTPGGSAGAFHASAAKGFEFLGIESNLAAAIAIVYHLIAFGSPFLVGLFFLIRDEISVKQLRAAVAQEMEEAAH